MGLSRLNSAWKKMAKVAQASKTAKAAAANKKQKKKKWSKGKVRDKLNNAVYLDEDKMKKLYKEVPTYKVISTSVLSDRLQITGSLARRAIKELAEAGLIRPVGRQHQAQLIYTAPWLWRRSRRRATK